jgi:PEGA domain-containing protein/tetratricopeptide repeat protein
MNGTRAIRLLALALALTAFAPAAWAQPRRRPRQPPQEAPAQDDATQRAREAYDRGRTQFAAGQYQDALASFQAAYDAKPHPTVLISIAECQEHLEDYRAAVATLEHYLQDSPDARDRADVEARIAAHRQRPAKLNITSEPTGAAISIDGANSGQVTPAELEVPPGEHSVALTLDGYTEATQQVTVEFAEHRDLPMTLEEAAPAEPEPATTPAPVEEERSEGKTGPIWLAAGIAGAALISGSVLGFLALSDKSDFDDNPTADTADRGERFALMADVSFGVAVAAGITTVALVLMKTPPRGEAQTPEHALRLHVAPLLSHNGGGVQAHLRF